MRKESSLISIAAIALTFVSTVGLLSCGDSSRPVPAKNLLPCAELGISGASPTAISALTSLASAVVNNDTNGALGLVVDLDGLRKIYPRLNDADSNPMSAEVLPALYHSENRKHLKRWFSYYAGKNELVPAVVGKDSVIAHKGFEMVTGYSIAKPLAMARSVVHCREGYKVWAVLDVRMDDND